VNYGIDSLNNEKETFFLKARTAGILCYAEYEIITEVIIILRPWRWRWLILPKLRLIFNGVQCVTFQMITFLIYTHSQEHFAVVQYGLCPSWCVCDDNERVFQEESGSRRVVLCCVVNLYNAMYELFSYYYSHPSKCPRYIVLAACEVIDTLLNHLKNGVLWDVTPCGSCKNRRFGGT
jgi:hypothetical protein